MYLRFITKFINEEGEEQTGVFQAISFIRDHPLTADEDARLLHELRTWFNAYLEAPTRFSHAKNKYAEPISLSWFKDSAKIHIQKLQEAISIIEQYDVVVERVKSTNPGYIVYEDECQVSAVPFKNERGRVK